MNVSILCDYKGVSSQCLVPRLTFPHELHNRCIITFLTLSQNVNFCHWCMRWGALEPQAPDRKRGCSGGASNRIKSLDTGVWTRDRERLFIVVWSCCEGSAALGWGVEVWWAATWLVFPRWSSMLLLRFIVEVACVVVIFLHEFTWTKCYLWAMKVLRLLVKFFPSSLVLLLAVIELLLHCVTDMHD